jgi:hypothetical protein
VNGVIAEGNQQFTLNTSDIAEGFYFIRISSEKGVQTFPLDITH